MKYQLVLQFPGEQIEDFDNMLKLEMDLALTLGAEHVVDGHDIGSGEMNIFIQTNNPEEAFSKAKGSLGEFDSSKYVAAYRDFEDEIYTVIFPANYSGVFCVN